MITITTQLEVQCDSIDEHRLAPMRARFIGPSLDHCLKMAHAHGWLGLATYRRPDMCPDCAKWVSMPTITDSSRAGYEVLTTSAGSPKPPAWVTGDNGSIE